MGSGFAKKKKEAKKMQEQFMKMQEHLKNESVEGVAGNGLVKIVLSGEHAMQKISINPSCVDPEDVEGLEDLIKAAYQDALKKLEKSMPSLSDSLGGGLGALGF
jgi:DNA-binding YbaB/EbfC family protein